MQHPRCTIVSRLMIQNNTSIEQGLCLIKKWFQHRRFVSHHHKTCNPHHINRQCQVIEKPQSRMSLKNRFPLKKGKLNHSSGTLGKSHILPSHKSLMTCSAIVSGALVTISNSKQVTNMGLNRQEPLRLLW